MQSPFPRRQLPALTGIRALAAGWIFARHFRVELLDAFPWLHIVAPLMNTGYLGVDLFFILSGFILTYTHFDGLTERPGGSRNWRRALGFLWLRLGRVWPLTAFVLVIFGLVFVAETLLSPDPAMYVGQLDPWRFLAHLLLVQGWTTHPLDWNGLDWSISAEWLAYLTFAVGVIGLGWFARVARSAGVIVAVALLTLPVIVIGFGMQDDTNLLFDHDSLNLLAGVIPLRVITEFWIGALLAMLLRDRMREGRDLRLPLPTIAAALGIVVIYLMTVFDPRRWVSILVPPARQYFHGTDLVASTETIVVLPLFVVLIAALAVTPRDPLARLLATRPLVLGGRVSFALYLSHPLVIGTVLAALRIANGVRMGGGPLDHGIRPGGEGHPATVVIVLVGIAAAWIFAWVLWRYIEEPARRLSRRALPPRFHP